jgi:hypothetical protein
LKGAVKGAVKMKVVVVLETATLSRHFERRILDVSLVL